MELLELCVDKETMAIRLLWLHNLFLLVQFHSPQKSKPSVYDLSCNLSPRKQLVSPLLFIFLSLSHMQTIKSIQFKHLYLISTVVMAKVIVKPLGCSLHIRSIRSSNIESFRPAIGLCNHFEFNCFSILRFI